MCILACESVPTTKVSGEGDEGRNLGSGNLTPQIRAGPVFRKSPSIMSTQVLKPPTSPDLCWFSGFFFPSSPVRLCRVLFSRVCVCA